MVLSFSRSRYSPIAVDFGADSLKLLQLRLGETPEVAAAASAVVPKEVRSDQAARERFVGEKLKELLQAGSFKGRRAVFSIPAFKTLVQLLEFPRVEPEELDLQVDLQLRERLNVEPERMVVRHFLVGEVARDGKSYQEVLCLAASRDVVNRHLEMAKRARLDVVGMHSEPLSLLRAFEHLSGGDGRTGRTLGFVDIGAATTKVVIAHGPEIAFAKTIQAAGDELTRQYGAAHGLEFAEARRARYAEAAEGGERPSEVVSAGAGAAAGASGGASTGLAALDAQMSVAGESGPAGASAGEDTIECLVDELQMSVRYHQRMFPDRPIDKLIFVGGEARDVRLCQRLARSMRIAAQLGDPLAGVGGRESVKPSDEVDLSRPQPGWAVPYGLCLSAS